jgi:hypothetical protein
LGDFSRLVSVNLRERVTNANHPLWAKTQLANSKADEQTGEIDVTGLFAANTKRATSRIGCVNHLFDSSQDRGVQ